MKILYCKDVMQAEVFDKSRVAQAKEIWLRIFCGKAVNTSCCGARRKRAGCLGGKQRKRVVASW